MKPKLSPNETKLYITEITEEGCYLDHLDLYNILEITDKIKCRTIVKGKEMRTAKQIICLAKHHRNINTTEIEAFKYQKISQFLNS